MSWSLDQIMADPVASAAFRAYLKTQYGEENYDFLTAVAKYQRAPSKAAAHQIFNQYLSDGAARQANISSENRAAIQDRLPRRFRPWQPPPPADLFDAAAKVVAGETAILIHGFVGTPAGAPYAMTAEEKMAAALAAAEAAAGGGGDIDGPPEAPDVPPDVGPHPDPADNPNADDHGDDHDHDESKSDGKEVVAEK
jgi:hypothetical protein